MELSSKSDYGLVALIELAPTFNTGEVMQVAEIAARQNIPDRYLEQMLTSLRRGGILRSIRGPRGGYQLLKSPVEISLFDVVTCLEGSGIGGKRSHRGSPEFEVLEELRHQLATAQQTLLKETSLQNLIERRNAKAKEPTMYFI